MIDEDRLEELKDRWWKGQEEGRNLAASDLCGPNDTAELIEALGRYIFDRLEFSEAWDRPGGQETPPPYIPTTIGRYREPKRLNSGTFGTVYLAFDDILNRHVAIKVPNPEYIANSAEFLREAQLLAQLRHPNIVPVYDCGEERWGASGTDSQNVCYIVTAHIAGGSLSEKLRTGKPTHYEVARLIADVCDALGAVHALNICHRDIKPANIMVDDSWKPVLIDFGLAVTQEALKDRTGYSFSPAYTSPEQAVGKLEEIDHRSDIFSIGVTFYELLTGQQAFTGTSISEVLRNVAQCHLAVPIDDRAIPSDLKRACVKALSRQPEDRYQSAVHMADDLRGYLRRVDKIESGEVHLLLQRLFETPLCQ
jgi:serine/threonine protein kinase